MEKLHLRPASCLLALLIAAAVLAASTFGAVRLKSSELYSKSRLISMIVTQEQINLTDMAGNKRNVDIMLKFVGALTSAYIDFELIPVGEVSTFAAVFESLPLGVNIEKFEYHRKNLTIHGYADNEEDYSQFLTGLRDTEYFENVTGHYYLTTEDTIRFELECISQSVAVFLEF